MLEMELNVQSSKKSKLRPYVSGIHHTAIRAGIQTRSPTHMSDTLNVVLNVDPTHMRSGMRIVTAPRMKLVTVEVTVTRRLVPKCSEVAVTKTERYPLPVPMSNAVR